MTWASTAFWATATSAGLSAAFLLGVYAERTYDLAKLLEDLTGADAEADVQQSSGRHDGGADELERTQPSSPKSDRTTNSSRAESVTSGGGPAAANGGAAAAPAPGGTGRYKMALLVRTDLKMDRGKAATQAAHAAVGAFKKLHKRRDPNLRPWEETGSNKVCLRVDTEEEFNSLLARSRAAGLPVHVVVDVVRSSAAPDRHSNPRTVMAVGPAPAEMVTAVTGHLKLL